MKSLSVMSVSACLMLALGAAWSGPAAVLAPAHNDMKTESPAAVVQVTPEQDAAARQSVKPASPAAEPVQPAKRINALPASHGEYAPLALFSLGSLAVGGAFYAINLSSRNSNVGYTAGGRSSLTNAMGFAGLTALIAAGSYLYFARDDSEPDRDWDAQVSGGVSPDGAMSVGAVLTLPLPSLSR